jgi:hypothetical protein
MDDVKTKQENSARGELGSLDKEEDVRGWRRAPVAR